ncbi:ATP-binding protein [Peredibacter sp. HCB2-198]|uniref:ATP-binding protein n=1 Tax=Peredibacter sp. HCB2-198 TaxID=3383025 RepID=UPI0038B4E1A9
MQAQSLRNIINIRLWNEVAIRNRITPITHIILCALSYFICHDMHAANKLTLLPYLIISLSWIGRAIAFKKFPADAIPNDEVRLAYYVCAMGIGLGWGLMFVCVHHFYGLLSVHCIFLLMQLAGQCSGGVATFSASPKGFILFLFPITLTPVIDLFFFGQETSFVPAGLFVLFTIFYLYQIKISHQYLRDSITNEIITSLERDKFKGLINAVPGFVSFIDKNLIYQAINDFGKNFYQEGSIIGKSVGFLHPESEFVRFVQAFMLSSKETAISELKIQFNGELKTFVVSIKKILEPIGGAVIVSVPMDELVEARENLRVQEAKSHYTAKLVSLGEMAAGIAHEINNPLAIIQGSSDQIEKIIGRSDLEMTRLLEYNNKIQRTVGRISRIIKSLKGLARNGENDPFLPFEFQTILEPCIEISRQRFRDENVELEIVPYDTTQKIVGQEIQLSQVLMNLINNAFDAALSGQGRRWVKVELYQSEHYFDIRVQDSGNGVPREIREKIMEPFFTTKPINKGTGLGLSISKNIMEQHQGTLLLDENSPHTTFVMRIKR